jgi:NADH:ubiquinone oxidoreductase subunit 6 (subunit J)
MMLVQAMFYLMTFLALASAVYVAATPNLVRSVFMFFITLFALAGLYVLALADFVAITQVVVYVGGILVLVIFAFMLSGRETLSALQKAPVKWLSLGNIPALFLAALFLVVLVNVILKQDINGLPWIQSATANQNVINPNDTMTQNIGINLMTRYLLPFEAISVLLLMALVGAAHLARKEHAGV